MFSVIYNLSFYHLPFCHLSSIIYHSTIYYSIVLPSTILPSTILPSTIYPRLRINTQKTYPLISYLAVTNYLKMTKLLLALLLSLAFNFTNAQNVFRTPYGAKYHLASCKSVNNVSTELTIAEALKQGLEPCKNCNPPKIAGAIIAPHKAKGKAAITYQCNAIAKTTKKRCRHTATIANGFCWQHTPKN